VETYYFCYTSRQKDKRVGFYRIAVVNGKTGFFNRKKDISYLEGFGVYNRFEYRKDKNKAKNKA
jgi:hypothetical protein